MVEQVGAEVSYVKPGDHVISCLSVFCGTCGYCATGHTDLCDNTEVKLPPGAARHIPLAEIDAGYARMKEGQELRSLIKFAARATVSAAPAS